MIESGKTEEAFAAIKKVKNTDASAKLHTAAENIIKMQGRNPNRGKTVSDVVARMGLTPEMLKPDWQAMQAGHKSKLMKLHEDKSLAA